MRKEDVSKKIIEMKDSYAKISEMSSILELFEKNFSREERNNQNLTKKVLDLINQLENQIELVMKLHKNILDSFDENEEDSTNDNNIEEIRNMSERILNVLSYIRQKRQEFAVVSYKK